MQGSGTTSSDTWRRARRGAALLALAPLLATVALTSPAQAAKLGDETTTTTTTAPVDAKGTTDPTQGRLSTGKRINQAADDAAGLDTGTTTDEAAEKAADDAAARAAKDAEAKAAEAKPAETSAGDLEPGDEGTERLTGKPGLCDSDGCGRLQPIVECSFKDPGTGLYNTVWSYRGGRVPVKIPPGWFNFYFPGAVNHGQPGVFTPGYHRSVVITTHKGTLTWVLGLRKATAPGKDCGHNPVPITGAGLSSIVTLFAVGALLGVVLVVRSRRRRSIRT